MREARPGHRVAGAARHGARADRDRGAPVAAARWPAFGGEAVTLLPSEPVWHVETLLPPRDYSDRQLVFACAVCRALNRGKLVLAVPPER